MRTRGVPSGAGRDVLVAAVWFVVLGVVAGVAWWQLAPDVVASRSDAGVVLDSEQLERQVGVDGWYGAFAAGGGLLSGLALLWWRRERPVLMVVLVAVGSVVAALVAYRLGVVLGPPNPEGPLSGAAVGATAPLDLRLQASGLVWAWPACALLGAVVLLVVRGPETSGRSDPQVHSETAPVEPSPR